MQRLPRDQTTVLTRQEDKARRDLTRLTRSPHRRPAKLIQSILLHGRRDQRRPHRPRSNSIDADPKPDLLVVKTAREGDNSTLRRRIIQKVWSANVGIDGSAINDCVAGFHVLEGIFGDEEVGVDIGVEGLEPLLSVVIALAKGPSCLAVAVHSCTEAWTYSVSSRIPFIMF